jgi:hypothetical protein
LYNHPLACVGYYPNEMMYKTFVTMDGIPLRKAYEIMDKEYNNKILKPLKRRLEDNVLSEIKKSKN